MEGKGQTIELAPVSGTTSGLVLPGLIAREGERAQRRFVEFFTANIRNPNTRVAYARAVARFAAWCERHGLGLTDIEPVHVAAFIEQLGEVRSKPTVKQHLAAIRMLFDWLVVGQVVAANPASAVRGPKHVVKRGKTPVLEPAEARMLLDSIPLDTISGLRDRALIGVMVYSFARVGAVCAMNVGDCFGQGRRMWLRLHEKGGKMHEVPAHHNAESHLDAYIQAAVISDDRNGPLFRSLNRKRQLTERRLVPREVLAMVKRRAARASLSPDVCCHTFRATGITAYLGNGGTLEHAQNIAGHESPRTTKLYDRTNDAISLSEIERIVL